MNKKIIKKILKTGLCYPKGACESCQEIFAYLEKYLKNKKILREQLAALEHIQWAHWTKYMLDNLTAVNKKRWRRQIGAPYNKLSKKEKDSDRVWADKVIKIIGD